MATTNLNEGYSFVGNSTDDKNEIKYLTNGSTFLEMDTGKVFIYDAERKVWYEL